MRLTTLREGLGIGRGEFADSVRIDRSSYTKIEDGKKSLNQDMAYRISLRWGVTMDYLYKGCKSDLDVVASTDALVGVAVRIRRLPGRDPALPLPDYATAGAAGMDLSASLAPEHRASGLTLAPGERALVPSGLAVAIPEGYEVQVRPRSGLAIRHGVTLVNSPGTIDSDYRGELGVIIVNHGAEPFTVEHGMRIAQLVLAPVVRMAWQEAAALDGSARGAGGFGSTGTAGRRR